MATPAQLPLTLYRGDTYHWRFQLWTDDTKSTPADLTDLVVQAQVRDKAGGVKVTDLVCTIELPNVITMDLLTEQWATMVPSKGLWDMQLTYPSGDVSTIIAGPVTVTADITT
jgi:hypothetical protein